MPHQCTDCGRTFADGSKEMLSGCPDCGGNKFQFRPGGVEGTDPPATNPPEPPDTAVDSSVIRTVSSAATAVRDLVGSSHDPEIGATDTGGSQTGSAAPVSTGSDPSPTESDPDTSDSPGSTDETGERSADDPEPSTPSAGPDRSVKKPASSAETAGKVQTAADDETATTTAGTEDAAQASARSDVVSTDNLPPAPDHQATRSQDGSAVDDLPDPANHPQDKRKNREPDRTDRPDLSELREELNDQFESIRVLDPGKYELNLMELYDREEYIIALQEDGKYTIQVPERWKD
jgi:predicted  nucleic acid-binding Zn-ribbon protein